MQVCAEASCAGAASAVLEEGPARSECCAELGGVTARG